MADERKPIVPGDWVRFQQGGILVIGKVEYVLPRKVWERSNTLVTDDGSVHEDDVLEVRRG